MAWNSTIKIKHLLTEDETHEGVQRDMNAVADVLSTSIDFIGFNVSAFRNIPTGDDVFKPVDYANRLLDRMYDYADRNRIWIA